jgi:hypothetical protein
MIKKDKVILYYHTLKYMKPIQVSYRLFYFLRNKFGKKDFVKPLKNTSKKLRLTEFIPSNTSYIERNKFEFLNLSAEFKEKIDWNYSDKGKLWTYNLNYFDFLNQNNFKKENGIGIIESYIKSNTILKDGLEPYPISLRGINWIKFFTTHSINNTTYDQVLYNHYQHLINKEEYHLLGNHLLENGFSLFFGAYYFQDELLLKHANRILIKELKEQTLNDGAHFELSPMYHQIILNRLLDCINLAVNNQWDIFKNTTQLIKYAKQMLGWLENITYSNGDIPMVNDSAWGIAPSSKELFDYAKRLHIEYPTINLANSGYRKHKEDRYELLMDVGDIGPTYIPGHAHADSLNFEIYLDNKPFIVDTGTSTYEKNGQRQNERSTFSHNTVVINETNSSNVWGGFRVAQRATTKIIEDSTSRLVAIHNGYTQFNELQQREFSYNEKEIIIFDKLSSSFSDSFAYLHFHPNVKVNHIVENQLKINESNAIIEFADGFDSLVLIEYNYCSGFNKKETATAIKIKFNKTLKTTICL